jgi:hypothetical protein
MRTCSICLHWKGSDWSGWDFKDEIAPCTLGPVALTNRNFTCAYAAITQEQEIGSRQRYLANKENGFTKDFPEHLLPKGDVDNTCIHYDKGTCCKTGDTCDHCAPYIEDEDEPAWSQEVEPSTNEKIKINQDNEEEDFESFMDDDSPEMDELVTHKRLIDIPVYKNYKHQDDAFERYKDETEIALFLEQGLGKSKVILDIAKYKFKKGDIDALLIIAPNGVHKQWAREQIPIWLQGVEYDLQIIGGRGGKQKGRRFKANVLQIVCTNIDTFSTPSKWKEITEWANAMKTFIVLDEATVIKSISSKRTERLLYEFNRVTYSGKRITSSTILSAARAILTGTPITNGAFDAWAIFEFLRPNYFNRNYYSFKAHYGMFWQMVVETGRGSRAIQVLINPEIWSRIKSMLTYNEAQAVFGVTENTYNFIHSQEKYDGPFKNVPELKEKMAPVAMFKTLEECVDMPGQLYTRRLLEMDGEQARVYKDMEDQLIAEYQDKVTDAKSKLTVYIRLQQIASGFISSTPEFNLIGDDDEEVWEPNTREITWIGKSNPKLDALISDIEACEGPCIVICHFSAEAERLFNELSSIRKCGLQTGWKKVGSIEGFQNREYDCLVANVRCISRGLNLQVANRMFFYSNTFSLEDRLQVESRIYRIGQTRKCEYTDYIMMNTIDMKTVAALRQKKQLLDYIRGTSVKQMLTEVDDVFRIEYDGVDLSQY